MDPDPVRRALFRGSELLRKRRYSALKRREERAKRIEQDDPSFAAYLRGEISWEEMTPLPKVRRL
jgi:hypothetical protein